MELAKGVDQRGELGILKCFFLHFFSSINFVAFIFVTFEHMRIRLRGCITNHLKQTIIEIYYYLKIENEF